MISENDQRHFDFCLVVFASRIVEHSWRMVDVAVQQSQFNLFGLLVVEGSLRARKN